MNNKKWSADLKIKTIVLPVGSFEAHGAHLPFTTDAIIPENMAEAVAKKVNTLVLPAIPYGNTQELANFNGTIGITAQGLANLVKEILESAISHGAEKIIIINGHDGNECSLETAARDVIAKSGSNVKLVVRSWWNLVPADILKELNLTNRFGHAGKEETSVMMHLVPDCVDIKKAIEQGFVNERYLAKHYFLDRKIPSEGKPVDASKELGKKIFDAVVDSLVELIIV